MSDFWKNYDSKSTFDGYISKEKKLRSHAKIIAGILEKYGKEVKSIDLIPGTGGVFELYLNGELIYSKLETGRHTNEGEILELMEKALS